MRTDSGGDNLIERIEVIAWRNEERTRVARELRDLATRLAAMLDSREVMETSVLTSMRLLRRKILPEINDAIAADTARIDQSLARSANSTFAAIDGESVGTDWGDIARLMGSVGVTIAPLALVPTAIGAATVTTTAFLVIPVTVVSPAILAVGIGGIAVASIVGSQSVRAQAARLRAKQIDKVKASIVARILDPRDPEGMLHRYHAFIDAIAREKLDRMM